MPSTMTHTYFGKDVIKKLSKEYLSLIDSNFYLFCQGPDPYMFNHFLLDKKSVSIQSNMHSNKTKDFFINTIKNIYENKYFTHPEIMSYLYGYICHYYLDLQTHPYIYYKSGLFKKNDKSTYQYNGQHQKMEYIIDLYMIEKREKTNHNQFRIDKKIFSLKKFSKELSELINLTLNQTYSYQNMSTLYYHSAIYMKLFYRFFNYDPHGIKQKIYKIWDKITPPSIIKLEELSFHQNYNEYIHYLNLEHNKWYYPWDNTKYFTTSFEDEYNIALENATNTIIKVTEMLKKDTWDQTLLNTLFQDLSYTTGLPCKKKLKMKYFE